MFGLLIFPGGTVLQRRRGQKFKKRYSDGSLGDYRMLRGPWA